MSHIEIDTAAKREPVERSEGERIEHGAVGRSVEKVDGRGLVTGEARYTDDIPTADALVGKILFSPHAHARIASIDTSDARDIDGVGAVLTRDDVPQHRYSRHGVPHPQPSPLDERIFDDKVRFVGDTVAAVAADTEEAAEEAIAAIEVAYEPLDHVLTPEAAMADGAPMIHDEDDYGRSQPNADLERNIVTELENHEGDVETGFASADHIVEGTYSTQTVQHAQMEMHVSIAWIDERDRLVLRTSTQTTHLVRDLLGRIFDMDRSQIRVIKPRVGGGFGGKQDLDPSQIIASALALQTGEMVRIELTREEDLFGTLNRTAMEGTVKMGVTDDGTITAMQLDITANTGAYGNHAVTILSSGAHEPLSIYDVDHRRFTGRSVYTNITPAGAMRGYGSPQGSFMVESHIDEVAEVIGMDPVALRRRNAVEDGDHAFDPPFSTSKRPFEAIGLDECIQEACASIGWEHGPTQPDDPRYRRGYGMGLAMHKSGVAGSEFAGADVTLEDDGSVTLRVGVGDIGQGAETAMAQIAADILGVEVAKIHVKADDTDAIPWDNGAYASSTTFVSGNATAIAAHDAADQLREVATRWLDGDPSSFSLEAGYISSPTGDALSIEECAGNAFAGIDGPKLRITGHGSFSPEISPKPFAAQIAEVEVDLNSGEFEVLQLVTAADVGYAIHPENTRGQVIGGAIMGLGQAIAEEITFDEDGRIQQRGLREYKSLRSSQIPENVECILVEPYEPSGPFGAKSVGETTIIGPLAAVANAVKDATGVRVNSLPITSEKLEDQLLKR